MKFRIFGVALLCVASTTAAFAQKDAPAGQENPVAVAGAETANIMVSPVGLAFGAIGATAEFKLSNSISAGPSLAYSSYKSGTSEATSFGFGAQATFYLSDSAFRDGWFVSPFFQYASASNELDQSASGMSVGADFGYGWFWSNGFNLMLGIGAQHISIDFSDLGLSDVGGTLPSMRLTLGFAF